MSLQPLPADARPDPGAHLSTISLALAEFAAALTFDAIPARIRVHMEKVNRGAGDRALSGAEIAAKFLQNAELVVARDHAERIRDFVLGLEHHDARELGRLLAGR